MNLILDAVDGRYGGQCIEAFLSPKKSVIGLILCISPENCNPYLTGRIKSVYKRNGEYRLSQNFFARHAEQYKSIEAALFSFLGEWEEDPAGAIHHLEQQLQITGQIETFKKELVLERRKLVKTLEATNKPYSLTTIDGPAA